MIKKVGFTLLLNPRAGSRAGFKNISLALIVISVVSFAIIVHGLFSIFWVKNLPKTLFDVKKGESFSQIAKDLKVNGIIFNSFWFKFYSALRGDQAYIKAGSYQLEGFLNGKDVLNILVEGKAISDDIEVIIQEGLNVWEIDKKLTESGLIKKGAFVKLAIDLEGYLFPDTYRFEKDSTASEIIEKLRANFLKKIEDAHIKLVDEDIILASILEKEVKTTEDMQIVTGILKKRLNRGIPLEVDATLAYGVCKGGVSLAKTKLLSTFFDGTLCDVSLVPIKDYLDFESLFNTYKKLGLPPAPISNPGIRAIQAALNPVDSLYLYYLSPRDGGPTVFSKTYQEHIVARKKYLGL